MHDTDNQINTIFVTKKDDPRPILIYDISNGSLAIDLHVQFINFDLDVLHYAISAKDQLGNEKLSNNSMEINFKEHPKLKYKINAKKGISETAFYIVMDADDLDGVKYLNITVTINHEYSRSIILYTIGGKNHG